MHPIKLVFSDMDGTLLNSRHCLSDETIQAVRALDRRGIPLVLASSRPPAGMIPLQDQLGIRAPLVSFGGALVLDADRAPVHSNGLPLDQAVLLQELIRSQCGVCCCAYSHFDWIVDDAEDPWVLAEQRITATVPTELPLSRYRGRNPVHKLLCMGSPDGINQAQALLASQFPLLSAARSKETYLEIMNPGVSKASAVRFLCAALGVAPEEALSVGDHFNDVDMFAATGRSAAMGNAPDEVKRAAQLVTLDNDGNGVAALLKTCGLI